MKTKTHLVTAILLSLILFITLGCQIASQAASTPEAESSSETVNSVTQAPTSTQPPKVDISSAVLTLDDLPSGFEILYPEDLGMSVDDFSDEDFQPEEVFIFINSQDFQMVIGFNFLLNDKVDRIAFDAGVSQPKLTLPAMVNGMGSEDIQDEKVLEGLDDVGEKQIGMTMITDIEGVPIQVDILMFRREVIGAMLMSMVIEGESPNITLYDLGLKLDQHFEESFNP